MEWLTKLTDLHKMPTRYVGLVAIVTGALLFSPVWFLDKLHLSTIPAPYGALVGVVFLVTSGLAWFLIHPNVVAGQRSDN
jgi:hypothetical protein